VFRLVDLLVGYENLTAFLLEENARLRVSTALDIRFPMDCAQTLENLEREILTQAVEQSGSYKQAARWLSMNRAAVQRRCGQLGIPSPWTHESVSEEPLYAAV
jgi:transcriptional regulator with GAF, ATPase, and Fis domain